MNGSVFIETTIPSYYVARRSRNIIQAARQELTIEWWDNHRNDYRLFSTTLVVNEASQGDPVSSAARLDLLDKIPLLPINSKVMEVANEILETQIVPTKASEDAFHIASAGVHGMDFLLTWNCTHIANPHNQRRIAKCFARHHIIMPVICTPEEFLGNDHGIPDF